MAEVVLWLVETTYVAGLDIDGSGLRHIAQEIGGVVFQKDGQAVITVTVAATSAAAAQAKTMRQLPEEGITSVRVHRAVSRR